MLDETNKILNWDLSENNIVSWVWEWTRHTVHDILNISYSLCWNSISHHWVPDTSHPHSATYFLHLQWPAWDYKFSLKWASFEVFLSLIHYEGTLFTPSKNQQRYMSELVTLLWENLISPVKGLGYYIWDISEVEDRVRLIDEYCINNLDPIPEEAAFSYWGKQYRCIGSTKQAGPRKYRFVNVIADTDEAFWLTYKEYEFLCQDHDENEFPYPLRKKLNAAQLSNKKFSKRASGYTFTVLWDIDTSVKWWIYTIQVTRREFKLKIKLRWVLFDLLKELLKSDGEIFIPKAGVRYMSELMLLLPDDFLCHITWLWYFIWDPSDIDRLESAKKRHRVNNLLTLKQDLKFSDGGKEYCCIWYSKQRAWSTYYFTVKPSNIDYITLPWISLELLRQLVSMPGKVVKTERSDRWKIKWIREAFGAEFLKTKKWKGVYIWTVEEEKDKEVLESKKVAKTHSPKPKAITKRSTKSTRSLASASKTQEWKKVIVKSWDKTAIPKVAPKKSASTVGQETNTHWHLSEDMIAFISGNGSYESIVPPTNRIIADSPKVRRKESKHNKPRTAKSTLPEKPNKPRSQNKSHQVIQAEVTQPDIIVEEPLPVINFTWDNTSLTWNEGTIILNTSIKIKLTSREYKLVFELVELWKKGKCKKIEWSEERSYRSILRKLKSDTPVFIDEIDAPGCVVSIWPNSYVKKKNSIFSSAK